MRSLIKLLRSFTGAGGPAESKQDAYPGSDSIKHRGATLAFKIPDFGSTNNADDFVSSRVEIEVKIDGSRWKQVPSFVGSGSRDRVYVLEIHSDGTVAVKFGDGVHGARPPTGTSNVVASYRTGSGSRGNLVGSYKQALDGTDDLVYLDA